jgi:hypothetical protein
MCRYALLCRYALQCVSTSFDSTIYHILSDFFYVVSDVLALKNPYFCVSVAPIKAKRQKVSD